MTPKQAMARLARLHARVDAAEEALSAAVLGELRAAVPADWRAYGSTAGALWKGEESNGTVVVGVSWLRGGTWRGFALGPDAFAQQVHALAAATPGDALALLEARLRVSRSAWRHEALALVVRARRGWGA